MQHVQMERDEKEETQKALHHARQQRDSAQNNAEHECKLKDQAEQQLQKERSDNEMKQQKVDSMREERDAAQQEVEDERDPKEQVEQELQKQHTVNGELQHSLGCVREELQTALGRAENERQLKERAEQALLPEQSKLEGAEPSQSEEQNAVQTQVDDTSAASQTMQELLLGHPLCFPASITHSDALFNSVESMESSCIQSFSTSIIWLRVSLIR